MLSASTVARKTRLLCVFCIYGKGKCFLGKTPAQRIRYAIKVGPHYLFTPLRSLFRLAAKDFYLVGTIWRKAENRVRKKVKWSQWCRQAAQLQDLFPAKIEAIKERYQREKIPVAFIVIYSTTFPSEPVFEKCFTVKDLIPILLFRRICNARWNTKLTPTAKAMQI